MDSIANKKQIEDLFHSFGISHNQKTAVFIDGSKFHAISKAQEFTVDILKLRNVFRYYTDLTTLKYYVKYKRDEKNKTNSLRPAIDILRYNGYNVFVKEYDKNITTTDYQAKVSTDVEMACDMMELPSTVSDIRNVFIVSGDSSLIYPVTKLVNRGIRVYCIAGTDENDHALNVSSDLRKNVTHFMGLKTFATITESLYNDNPSKPND